MKQSLPTAEQLKDSKKIFMTAKHLWVEPIEDLPCEVTDCVSAIWCTVEQSEHVPAMVMAEPELELGLCVVDGERSIYVHVDGGVEVFVRRTHPGEVLADD